MKNLYVILTLLLCCSAPLFGAIVEHVGTGLDWTTDWSPLAGLNDPNDSVGDGYLDFVGDSSDAGAYWADNGTYVFFRFRVAETATPLALGDFSGSHLLLLDVDNYAYGTGFGSDNVGVPDYAFAWDGKSNDPSKHGLELSVLDTAGTTWGTTRMDDVDGSAGQKLVNDINGDGRTGDGYIRTVDNQATDNLGTTAFIDFAVSWSYLETYTDLEQGQIWNVALGSIADATDHNPIAADVGGGVNPNDLVTEGWVAVPEPATMSLIGLSGLGLLISRRLKSRA